MDVWERVTQNTFTGKEKRLQQIIFLRCHAKWLTLTFGDFILCAAHCRRAALRGRAHIRPSRTRTHTHLTPLPLGNHPPRWLSAVITWASVTPRARPHRGPPSGFPGPATTETCLPCSPRPARHPSPESVGYAPDPPRYPGTTPLF